MDMRRIGTLEVSVVGLGTNNFGLSMQEDEVPPVVDAALASGINFFDTADSYLESEERLGRALGRLREEVVIGTKFGSPLGEDGTGGAAPSYLREAVERNLRRLGTDRIDLYQLHRPDSQTPIADTLGMLDDLVNEGKVREIGCSNFSAEQLREAKAAVAPGGAHFVSVQNHYNLLNRVDEQEVLPECQRLGLAYLPYFPLASGLLTGKYTRGEEPPAGTPPHRGGWGAARGHGFLDLAFSWLAAKPVVASVIAGATKAEQVRANVVAGAWQLSPEEAAEGDALAPITS